MVFHILGRMIDINRIQYAQMVGVFTVFRLIGRRTFARSTADGRRIRSSAAIDLRIDRSIAVSPFHRGTNSSTTTTTTTYQ